MADIFAIGDAVYKRTGYKFTGRVLGTFTKRDGKTRFVNVENEEGWVMHFREADLAKPELNAGLCHPKPGA